MTKAELTAGINKLQAHFEEEVTVFSPKVKKDILQVLCLGYMKRYVRIARAEQPAEDRLACTKCSGTGEFRFTNGAVGNCYRCKGKGFEDEADKKRNYGWLLNNRGPKPADPEPAAEEQLLQEAAAQQPPALPWDEDDLVF
jgi:hypothetical protein